MAFGDVAGDCVRARRRGGNASGWRRDAGAGGMARFGRAAQHAL